MGIKIQYQKFMSQQFVNALHKVASTNMPRVKAIQVTRRLTIIENTKDKIVEEFKAEMEQKFATRDEKGVIVRPEGQPDGFIPADDKISEFLQAQESFGKREVEIDVTPLPLSILGDTLISPRELEALGGLFHDDTPPESGVPSAGPGVPTQATDASGNVVQLR